MLNQQSVSPTFSNTQIKFNQDNVEISTLAKFEFSEGKPLISTVCICEYKEFTKENLIRYSGDKGWTLETTRLGTGEYS